MSDVYSPMKFNNAAQRVFGGTVRPVVLVCETNDRELPWYAEARLISHDDKGQQVVVKVSHASASRKKTAKAEAAALGYQWLRSNYPTIDLSNV